MMASNPKYIVAGEKMLNKTIKRIMIAGTNSGCGKTTVTCAVLKSLLNKGLKVAAFKCGPDYIDPMFHSEIIGVKSRNIDLFLCGNNPSKYLFVKNSEDFDISVVEGVMGFYDGLSENTSQNSSCDISNKLDIPVILVVSYEGASLSVVAMIKGYLEFLENNIRAVILNNVSKPLYPFYKKMIEGHVNIRVLGYMPNEPKAALESRHLGLVTAQEVNSLNEKVDLLAKIANETIELDELLKIADATPPLQYEEIIIERHASVKIAVARDKAFCFYYEDNLDLLSKYGAELISFSPLEDKELPENIDGLILGGGYPELYLQKLSENKSMLTSINDACSKGLPVYAECGGYMYLGKSIAASDGKYPMAGVIDMNSVMTDMLQNFGYITLAAKEDTMFLKSGENVPAHEFHYSKSDKQFDVLHAQKSNGKSWNAGYCENRVFAGYPHIHFWADINLAKRFIAKCKEYKNR